MRVLVVGGAGYIGSVTVESLLDAGHRVTVFDDLSYGHPEAVDPRARLVQGTALDVRRTAVLQRCRRQRALRRGPLAGDAPDSAGARGCRGPAADAVAVR